MDEDEVPAIGMSMMYDSERYSVVCFPYVHHGRKTYGIEIVDKAVNAEVFLFPPFREAMDNAIERWKINVPHADEVEAFLGEITSLAMQPLVVH